MRWKRLLSLALVAGVLLAVQVTVARAERRVTGQVTFEDAAGDLIHASFNVFGDNEEGSGRVEVRSDNHSWSGDVNCVDFPPTGAGWANFTGPVTGGDGIDASATHFHVEVVGQGQGNLPADYIRVRLLEGPYQGDLVLSQVPYETQLIVGAPEDSSSCEYGPDLAWGALTSEHFPVIGGNLQVHGPKGNGRQHGLVPDEPTDELTDPDPSEPEPGEGGDTGSGGTSGLSSKGKSRSGGSDAAARRATGGVVYDDGGLIHVNYNVFGENEVGGGTVRVRSDDLGFQWVGEVDCVDFEAGFANFNGPIVSSSGISGGFFHVEVVGNGQGQMAPDWVKVEILHTPYTGDVAWGDGCLYGDDLGWGVRNGHHDIVKGNLQVHDTPGSTRQHEDGGGTTGTTGSTGNGDGSPDPDPGDPADPTSNDEDGKPGKGDRGKSGEDHGPDENGETEGGDESGEGSTDGDTGTDPVDDDAEDRVPEPDPDPDESAPGNSGDAPGHADGGPGKGKNRD